ncbi:MAG: aldehyde dehydrogenase family protein [Candidatus Woesearchaeota archaeon]|nr:aldehyde dehydrogenase family protein [Candidatus Woesearchaeota archaeon]
MQTYQQYIDGRWISSSSGTTFESLDPATEKPIGRFQQGNEKDVQKAVDAAKKAFPLWSDIPAPKRGEILFDVAHLLKKNKERLARIVTIEMGKVLKEGRGDVQEAIDVFEYVAGEGRRLFGHTTPSELKNKFCMTMRAPVGVCGLITPWNFPIAIPAWKLAPALICGNTVVFKPSSDTPLCAIELVKILEEAGVPKGVVNLVTGPGGSVGRSIITHKDIRAVSFTGHRSTGDFILRNAGIKKIGLEMGGKNPIIIMDDADLDLAIEGVLWAGFGTSGQRCTAASRVLVHHTIQKEFENKLLRRIEKLRLGSGLKSTTDIGPLINKQAVEKVDRYTHIGKKEATLRCGGTPAKINGHGFFYKPTLFTNVKPDARIAQEEIFGPTVSVITVKDLNNAIHVANNIKYGLSSSIYTANINAAFRAMEKIEAGIVYINAPTIGAEVHLPFGGVKGTGNGTREAGIEGIHEFSETKVVYIDYSHHLQKAQGID